MAKSKALGRGLGALLGEIEEAYDKKNTEVSEAATAAAAFDVAYWKT